MDIRFGMRRILKRGMPAHEYIKKGVETGVYRTNEELAQVMKERSESADDLRIIMRRFRQDIVRGTSIHDYPDEYLILEQHPPIPDPPRVQKKYMKERLKKLNPIDHLTKQYLQRQQHDVDDSVTEEDPNAAPKTAEAYYRKLLGVQRAQTMRYDTALTQKPAVVQRAYASAIRHYELQRTEGFSDAEALRRVDELLAAQDVEETRVARERRLKAQKMRADAGPAVRMHAMRDAKKKKEEGEPKRPRVVGGVPPLGGGGGARTKESSSSTSSSADASSSSSAAAEHLQKTVASIFDANPMTLEGMMRWSERLQTVPYTEWTVGASTAMDHWIARQILGLSEETWQSILEGIVDDPSLSAKGRDIVAVREALFPETILEEDRELLDKEHMEAVEKRDEEDAATEETEKDSQASINELLASLGGLKSPDGDDAMFDSLPDWQRDETDGDLDERTERLIVELQGWREKNQITPYKDWGDADKQEFDRWIKGYVATLLSDAERSRVDLDSTREVLLSSPPVTAEASESFWGKLQDEADAEELLDAMVFDGAPPGASILQSAFWDLPREEQLQRLLNLGALRPLLDEYTKETDRLRFLQRHGDAILSGVELEYLVSDSNGPIRTTDLGSSEVVQSLRVPDDARFRLEKRPYQSIGDVSSLEKSRVLYKAWNEHKAGRARYEEARFVGGHLGLKYSDKQDEKKKRDK